MVKRISAWWGAHKPTNRRLIQIYAALLYNANLKGFIEGDIYTGATKNLCVPGLNCYSCPGAVGACPLGALQNALASSGSRAPYYVLGILMLFGLTLGRTICGWLCPFGLIQELLHKIPVPKLKKSRFTRALSWLKYLILAVFVAAIPLAYAAQNFPVPAFCKYICPAGTLEGALALLANPVNAGNFSLLNILFTRKFIIMVIIFAACVFIYRAFCRFLCPLGAIYGLFSRVSILGVKVEAAKCTSCERCVARCKMDIKRVGDRECIHCGECIADCPTGAISLSCGKLRLLKKEARPQEHTNTQAEKPRRARAVVAWAATLAVLACALWYYNRPADAQQGAPQPSQAAAGALGTRCPDFTVPLYGEQGGSFSYEPGKVTVINFWATYCTPCIGELPYFERLEDNYGEDIALVAIHAELVTDDVQAFLDAEGFTIPFALDDTGGVITSLGGSTLLPMTVIVDKDGTIVYNKEGSVTYELLESVVAPLV